LYVFLLIFLFLTLQTALCHACTSGILPIVQLLSEIPHVDVNLGDKEGNTPLIFAAQAGILETKESEVLMLLSLQS
jgi:ankyrin repeat protein